GNASNEVNVPNFAIDGNNKLHVAFQAETNGSGLDGGLYYTNNVSGSWAPPTVLAAGAQGMTQGNVISIVTDAANKVHLVHHNYQGLIYLNNVSGSFTGGQINGNLTGGIDYESFRMNSSGD